MPTRKPSTRASRAQKLTRPAAWWREPLSKSQLAAIATEEGREAAIERARFLAVEQVKSDIRRLREFSTEFGAAQGYSLNTRELIRLHPSKRKKLFEAVTQLNRATSRPFVTVTPRTANQKKNTKLLTGAILPGQKKFIYHTYEPERTSIRYVKGQPEVVTKTKGGELLRRQYLFPRRPRDWQDVIDLTIAIQKRGMRTGNYKVINSLYGTIDEPIERDKLVEQLNNFYSQYSQSFAGTILGFEWVGDTLDSAFRRQRKVKTMQEKFAERRAYERAMEKRRLLEASGLAKRCKKCRRKKCKCPPPRFK